MEEKKKTEEVKRKWRRIGENSPRNCSVLTYCFCVEPKGFIIVFLHVEGIALCLFRLC